MVAIKFDTQMQSDVVADVFVSRVQGKASQKESVSPRVWVGLLSNGVPGGVLRHVVQHIPKDVVTRTIGTDNTNLAKFYRRQRLTGKVTEELNDLTKLWAELREFFGWDEELLKEWIEQKLPVLDGATPSELMSSSAGRVIIRQQLDAMRYGDFA